MTGMTVAAAAVGSASPTPVAGIRQNGPTPTGHGAFAAALADAAATTAPAPTRLPTAPATADPVSMAAPPPSITLAAALGLAPPIPVPAEALGIVTPLGAGGGVVPVSGPEGATADPPTGTGSARWKERLPTAGRRWADQIDAAATRHGLDPRLLAALVRAESGFRQEARSHAGAIGLAQLMPATARGLGVDPYDPAQNLDGGARFLKSMLRQFGSNELALAAYNAGPGRVERAGGIPDIAETRAYVPRVLGFYEQLSR